MAKELFDLIYTLIDGEWQDQYTEDMEDVRTFEEAGILSNNLGLVVTYKGKEYQIEINGTYGSR